MLANKSPGTLMLLEEIAGAAGLPPRCLAEIFQKLTQHDLVESHRGAVRGYSLAGSPDLISAREILEAIEGPELLGQCGFWSDRRHATDPCCLHAGWAGIRPMLQALLERATLGEMAG